MSVKEAKKDIAKMLQAEYPALMAIKDVDKLRLSVDLVITRSGLEGDQLGIAKRSVWGGGPVEAPGLDDLRNYVTMVVMRGSGLGVLRTKTAHSWADPPPRPDWAGWPCEVSHMVDKLVNYQRQVGDDPEVGETAFPMMFRVGQSVVAICWDRFYQISVLGPNAEEVMAKWMEWVSLDKDGNRFNQDEDEWVGNDEGLEWDGEPFEVISRFQEWVKTR